MHVALLNTGVSNEALSTLSLDTLAPHLRDTSVGFGQDARQLLGELGIFDELGVDDATEDAVDSPLTPPQYRDLKSERFYGSMARQTAPGYNGVGVMLMSILSQVNTARVIVPIVTEQNEVAAFKIRFVSLFHAATSLQNLLDKNEDQSFLHPDAVQQIRAVLPGAVRRTRKKKSLRNVLVHYGIDDEEIASRLSTELPLCGLVEAHASGKSLSHSTRR